MARDRGRWITLLEAELEPAAPGPAEL